MTGKQYKKLRSEFADLVAKRLRDGAAEYGEDAFVDNNTFEMIYEEIADLVNYCMFTYVKLRLIEEQVDARYNTGAQRVHEEVETTPRGASEAESAPTSTGSAPT
jgi:hypothetical protein